MFKVACIAVLTSNAEDFLIFKTQEFIFNINILTDGLPDISKVL